MYSFQRESLSAEVKADDSRISARDYNNLDSQAPEVPADTSLGVSNHLSFPYMREASEPASIWPTQGLTAPRSLPQPTELQSLSHSVDPDADTVRQPDGGLDFDAPPPNNRLEFSLDLSPFEESGFLPFDENEAFLLPPPAQTEGMTPLLIASQPPELQLLAPMSQGPSIDLTASTSPDPWRSLGDFGLAEESFQPNIASAARMQGEDDAIPSNQAATRNSKWEFDSQPGGTCDADVPVSSSSVYAVSVHMRPSSLHVHDLRLNSFARQRIIFHSLAKPCLTMSQEVYPNEKIELDFVLERTDTHPNNEEDYPRGSNMRPLFKCLACDFIVQIWSEREVRQFLDHLDSSSHRKMFSHKRVELFKGLVDFR
jgi:hypothetical protein